MRRGSFLQRRAAGARWLTRLKSDARRSPARRARKLGPQSQFALSAGKIELNPTRVEPAREGRVPRAPCRCGRRSTREKRCARAQARGTASGTSLARRWVSCSCYLGYRISEGRTCSTGYWPYVSALGRGNADERTRGRLLRFWSVNVLLGRSAVLVMRLADRPRNPRSRRPACGMRKSGHKVARVYSWMSPPGRSVRWSWCRGDALPRGALRFLGGAV